MLKFEGGVDHRDHVATALMTSVVTMELILVGLIDGPS